MQSPWEYPYVKVFKWHYGNRRHQRYVVYELNCGPNRRQTYLDFEPFGIVDEVHMEVNRDGRRKVYRGFNHPVASENGLLGIPNAIEKRFAEIREAVRPSVDVEKMPWCDVSGPDLVDPEVAMASQAKVRVSSSFCKNSASP